MVYPPLEKGGVGGFENPGKIPLNPPFPKGEIAGAAAGFDF
jgi:hypothetical protein